MISLVARLPIGWVTEMDSDFKNIQGKLLRLICRLYTLDINDVSDYRIGTQRDFNGKRPATQRKASAIFLTLVLSRFCLSNIF